MSGFVLLAALGCGGPSSPAARPCATGPGYADLDGDGHGDPARPIHGCDGDAAFASLGADCDDADPTVHPGAGDLCDAVADQDCDGSPNPSGVDLDLDGLTSCDGDCDDANATVGPGLRELCNGIDDDCDGQVNQDDLSVDVYTCGYCPDAAGLADATWRRVTTNPCLLDPTVSLCSDDPERPDTATDGRRLHRVIWRDDGAPLREELLLFVPPGAGDHNERTLEWAAYAGYRVLNLGWQSDPLVAVCDLDAACYESFRRELTYGDDTSPHLDVPPNDALVGRLEAALRWLAEEHATDGFDRYWTEAEGIRWDRIVLWGWSVGASEAAYLSRYEPVDGVVLVSGPKEIVGPPYGPSPWLAVPPAGLECAQFGFYHALESRAELCDDLFATLGMALPAVDVDLAASPYDEAQVLETSASDFRADWCNYHEAMAMDECMSDELFAPYLYMFCRAGEIESCPRR